jgi:hypothetical protein
MGTDPVLGKDDGVGAQTRLTVRLRLVTHRARGKDAPPKSSNGPESGFFIAAEADLNQTTSGENRSVPFCLLLPFQKADRSLLELEVLLGRVEVTRRLLNELRIGLLEEHAFAGDGLGEVHRILERV